MIWVLEVQRPIGSVLSFIPPSVQPLEVGLLCFFDVGPGHGALRRHTPSL